MAVLVTAAISICLPGAALAGCMSGLSDAPMAQMACCQHGHHECDKAGSSGDCCKTNGHDQQNTVDQQSIAKTFSIAKISGDVGLSVSARPLVPQPLLTRGLPWVPLFAGTSSPPRFAFSILLI